MNKKCGGISTQNILHNNLDGYYDGKKLSFSMERYLEQWGQKNHPKMSSIQALAIFFLKGLEYEEGVSRRDPSTIIKIKDTYYVYYTRSSKTVAPVGYKKATKTVPANTWDLCDIYYATSKDGINWEEQGVSVSRGPEGSFDDRSDNFTPDILQYEGKYYLYYQAVSYPLYRTFKK